MKQQRYLFEHKQLGELGQIVLTQIREGETLMQAEFYQGQDKPQSPAAKKRKAVFEQVVATVYASLDRISQDHDRQRIYRRKNPFT